MESLALNLVILLPLAAAIAICFAPEARASRWALGVGLITLLLSFGLWTRVGDAALIGETNRAWINAAGFSVRYHIGLDALSAPLVLLTAVLTPLSVACSFSAIRRRQREFYAWLMALTSAMFGVFAARDLILFYIFFEFTLVPLYFLIGVWGGAQRRFAANKFFIYTFVGSVITFAGVIYLGVRAAGGGAVSFELDHLSRNLLSGDNALTATEQFWLFIAFFSGFAIKVPLFPLHTWLPLAHTEAPTAGSVLLAGVLLKLGTYGFLRFALPLTPSGAQHWAAAMGVLAIAGVIYGALCCWVQTDVKKLVAYSSVSHLGFCMLGMFSLEAVGLNGSVLYMINHGLSTGALFLVVGMIYERYHTRDIDKLGGLAWRMPVMAFFLIVFTLSSIGLPGLNGFVSEFTVLFAAFNSQTLGPWYGVVGATGILLGAIYMLYMCGKVLFGPVREPEGTPDLAHGLTTDLNRREIAILAPLAALVVVLGVAPRLVTDPLDPLHRDILAAFAQPTEATQDAPPAVLTTPALSDVVFELPEGEPRS